MYSHLIQGEVDKFILLNIIITTHMFGMYFERGSIVEYSDLEV